MTSATNLNHTLPFRYSDVDLPMKRLIIEPVKVPETITESGLKIPAHHLNETEIGIVYATDKDSSFKPGDEVQYRKVDRAINEKMETISIGDKVYDVVYEHKISCVNNNPYNMVFVKVVSDAQVTEAGIVIPANTQSITRKGVVFAAPDYFHVKKGDRIEYFNQIKGFYLQVNIEGQIYECVYDSDIFVINGEVSPFRMIVKIDLVAQHIKRSSTYSGLKLSPLFIAMLRNLQYAEIASIGDEAQKKYPDLKKGDTILMDHAVESQDYRILRYDLGKEKQPIYEYRIINCYDFSERDIFGKLHYHKETKNIISITPINDSVFLEWEFEHFENDSENTLSVDSLSQYKNIADLKNAVGHRRATAAEIAKMKTAAKKTDMARISPQTHPELWAHYAKELAAIEREEKRTSAELRKDLWVVCKTVYPRQIPAYVIAPYEELYPINIMGKKFLIAHSDFLLFQTHKNMNISVNDMFALSDNVLVLPIEEESKTGLVIPTNARQRPQYGKVIKIKDHPDGIEEGDMVLFRQFAGLEQEVDGIPHLIMKHNDLLMVVPGKQEVV